MKTIRVLLSSCRMSSEEMESTRGDRNAVCERINFGHSEMAHLHLPGEEQFFEVSPGRVPVYADLTYNIGDAQTLRVFLEDLPDSLGGLLYQHHGRNNICVGGY